MINFETLSVHGNKQIVNHFERHDQLTTKNHLFQNMLRFSELNKQNVFECMPI